MPLIGQNVVFFNIVEIYRGSTKHSVESIFRVNSVDVPTCKCQYIDLCFGFLKPLKRDN